jgi:hypothetical protein
MENTASLGLLAVHKSVSKYAERIYAYMEKTQRDTELRIPWLIMAQHENLFRSLLFTLLIFGKDALYEDIGVFFIF